MWFLPCGGDQDPDPDMARVVSHVENDGLSNGAGLAFRFPVVSALCFPEADPTPTLGCLMPKAHPQAQVHPPPPTFWTCPPMASRAHGCPCTPWQALAKGWGAKGWVWGQGGAMWSQGLNP